MKKIFMNLSAGTTLAVAVALASCNNAEEVKKQVDAQNATIQTLVDEKLNALTEQVNTECATKVDSLATTAFAVYQEEAAKLAKKGVKKPAPKPKPAPKKEESKPVDPKKDKMNGNQQTNVEEKKTKMSGGTDSTSLNKKKNKMSGGK